MHQNLWSIAQSVSLPDEIRMRVRSIRGISTKIVFTTPNRSIQKVWGILLHLAPVIIDLSLEAGLIDPLKTWVQLPCKLEKPVESIRTCSGTRPSAVTLNPKFQLNRFVVHADNQLNGSPPEPYLIHSSLRATSSTPKTLKQTQKCRRRKLLTQPISSHLPRGYTTKACLNKAWILERWGKCKRVSVDWTFEIRIWQSARWDTIYTVTEKAQGLNKMFRRHVNSDSQSIAQVSKNRSTQPRRCLPTAIMLVEMPGLYNSIPTDTRSTLVRSPFDYCFLDT
jgi:hypothetical protein